MTKKFKKFLFIFTILLTTVVLVSCSSTADQLTKALDKLEIQYAEGDNKDSVTKNLTLPATSEKIDITWTSKNSSVVTNQGKVNQTSKDESVELVATATKGEETKNKSFTLTVKASSAKIVETATNRLQIPGITAGVVNIPQLDLPNKVTVDGTDVNVTWSTNDPLAITPDGTVFRPAFGADNTPVKLTATLSFAGESKTKVFDLTVAAKTVKPDFTGNVAGAFELAKGKWVVIKDATVVGIVDDGFYVTDDSVNAKSQAMYVYTSVPKWLKVGDVVDVEGAIDIYYSAIQINKGTTEPVAVSPAEGDAVEFEANKTEGLAKIAKKPAPTDKDLFKNTFYTIEGIVHIEGTGDYNTYLTVVDGYTGKLDKSKAIVFYYKGNKTDVEALAGKKIELDVFLHGYRSDHKLWSVNFTGTADDITEKELTAEEKIAAAKGQVFAGFPTEIIKNRNLTLAPKIGDVTVTWASDNQTIINPETGVVTIPTGDRVEVTLTATLAIEGSSLEPVEVTHKINVGKVPVSSIGDITKDNKNVGKYFSAKGIVTEMAGNNLYGFQDATGGIAVFQRDDLGAILKANLGKEITLTGKKDLFNGLFQLKDLEVFTAAEFANATLPTAVDISADLGNNDELVKNQAKLVTVKDAFVTKVTAKDAGSGDSTYKTLELVLNVNGEEIVFRMDSRAFTGSDAVARAVKVGDKVTVSAVMGWYNGAQLAFTNANQLVVTTATDKTKAEFAALQLNLKEKVTGKDVLDLPVTGANNATITWASGNVDVVTISTDFKKATFADIQVEAIVTLTATVKVGAETVTRAFEVRVRVFGAEEVLVKYDFTKWKTAKGTELKTQEDLITNFNLASSVTGKIVKAEGLSRVYQGNGTGGDDDANNPGVLKTGTGKIDGTMKLTLTEEVSMIRIVGRGWGNTDTITINGVTKTLNSSYGEGDARFGIIEFELTEESKVLDFVFGRRVLLTSIEFII